MGIVFCDSNAAAGTIFSVRQSRNARMRSLLLRLISVSPNTACVLKSPGHWFCYQRVPPAPNQHVAVNQSAFNWFFSNLCEDLQINWRIIFVRFMKSISLKAETLGGSYSIFITSFVFLAKLVPKILFSRARYWTMSFLQVQAQFGQLLKTMKE
jgi:hypothetical protein